MADRIHPDELPTAGHDVRVLADRTTTDRLLHGLTRRGFFTVAAAGAASVVLAACGGDDKGSSSATGAGSTPATGGSGGSGGSGANKFNLFTWADYDDPDLMSAFGTITVDVFDSNEQAVQKLQGAKGSSGYDVVVPTGPYVAQLATNKLIAALDLARITNFGNLDPLYTNQPWDPGNAYSVCKDWGTTGWMYDTKAITTPIATWNDFLAAGQGVASGKLSVLNSPPDLCGIYFWANGIDWTTEKKEDLDACEAFIVGQFAKHIKAFDSFPVTGISQGNFVLSHMFNGDARKAFIEIEDAGDDPKQFAWAMGAPKSELFMDNWCIVEGAKNVDAAYNFINYILTPENSVKDLVFHGYNTGIKGLEALLPANLRYKEMILFTPEEVARMQAGAVNSAQDRLVDIYDKAKAAAGG